MGEPPFAPTNFMFGRVNGCSPLPDDPLCQPNLSHPQNFGFYAMNKPNVRGMLDVETLKQLVADEQIETILTVFPDL